MAWEDWSDDFRELFEDTPGIAYLDDDQLSRAEALYDAGFTMTSDEIEAAGYSPDDVAAIRESFFDLLGIDSSDFDWQEWREAMGYE